MGAIPPFRMIKLSSVEFPLVLSFWCFPSVCFNLDFVRVSENGISQEGLGIVNASRLRRLAMKISLGEVETAQEIVR